MNIIIDNSFFKEYVFESYRELSTFLNNQQVEKRLSVNDYSGDYYYCYISVDALTKEKRFLISFSSDFPEDKINFVLWNEKGKMLIDTGKMLYLVDGNLTLNKSFETATPLIGLHFISEDKILLLEEIVLRIIDFNGNIVKEEQFDIIRDFSIKDNMVFINNDDGQLVFELD
jgi:hypothetical protein